MDKLIPDPVPQTCTYCDMRHTDCNIEYDKECPEFILGRCISCFMRNVPDEECIQHQHVYDYQGCDRYEFGG